MKYQVRKNLEEQNISGEIVIFDTESFKFYELNKTMSLLWSALQQPQTKEALVKKINTEFDANKSKIEEDVDYALEQLQKLSLINRIE